MGYRSLLRLQSCQQNNEHAEVQSHGLASCCSETPPSTMLARTRNSTVHGDRQRGHANVKDMLLPRSASSASCSFCSMRTFAVGVCNKLNRSQATLMTPMHSTPTQLMACRRRAVTLGGGKKTGNPLLEWLVHSPRHRPWISQAGGGRRWPLEQFCARRESISGQKHGGACMIPLHYMRGCSICARACVTAMHASSFAKRCSHRSASSFLSWPLPSPLSFVFPLVSSRRRNLRRRLRDR